MNKKYWSILVVPGAHRKTWQMQMRPAVVKGILILALLVVIGFGGLSYFFAPLMRNAFQVTRLKITVDSLSKVSDSLALLKAEIQKIRSFEEKILEITGQLPRSGIRKTSHAVGLTEAGKNSWNLAESSIDEFINRIRLKRNRQVLASKNKMNKIMMLGESIPKKMPLDGWISRGFEMMPEHGGRPHPGIDVAAPLNTAIRCSAPGIVISTITHRHLGKLVVVDHGHGFQTRYGHCSRILVARGDFVKEDMPIALVGNSGNSSAPHLHYEVLRNGVSVDPLDFIIN